MNDTHIVPLVITLDDPAATLELAGGKGASLARLAAAGLPVPPGFHITTSTYRRFVSAHGLQEPILAAIAAAGDRQAAIEAAARQIAELFASHALPDDVVAQVRAAYKQLGDDLPVAVRSSATAEDLPDLSFAGQQESFLNIRGEAELLDAVKRCWASLWTARAIAYRARHEIANDEVALAVVVQELVPAEAAGILFSANPLTGARDQILINAAWGLGEAIVGGQVTPDTIVIDKTSGSVIEQQVGDKRAMTVRASIGTAEAPVPDDRRGAAVLSAALAAELAGIGERIERLYGTPVDVEWALAPRTWSASHADGNGSAAPGDFFIVQARPITTLRGEGVVAEEWNDSLRGDYLWTNGNVGEAVPDVMTPSTWSLVRIFIADTMAISSLSGYPMIGNLGGRFYMNLSVLATLAGAFGLSSNRFSEAYEQAFGRIPAEMEPPRIPMSRWRVVREVLPIAIRLRRRVAANEKELPAFVASAPARCEVLRAKIAAVTAARDLIAIWHQELLPFFRQCSRMLEAGARRDGSTIVWTRRTLNKLVGEADASALLSGLHSGAGQLASLGLLLDLDRVARGEIDRAEFARRNGHRGPHEFEVSVARPGEDPGWIDQQLAGLRAAPLDTTALLARQETAQHAAWERFVRRFPRKAAAMKRQIGRAAEASRYREAARSEVIRVFWALRAFVLRAGELTGHGEDLFFLTIEEILGALGGEDKPLAHVPARRAAYARYSALPPYPALIRGRFDPFRWAADPNRRADVFDARGTSSPPSATITGFPGAAGVVEGRARVIPTVEQGDQLQAGEILVTTVTNVGWTPLFPRAAAVVTDVGAPLSHAAIVARELGIPAVVGCGNATMRLHTGDWLRVDGEHGTVEVLRKAGS
jgi:phosphohistidine swiveling domain-containing protein